MRKFGQAVLGVLILYGLIGCRPIVPSGEPGEQSEPVITDLGPTPGGAAPATPTATTAIAEEITMTPDFASNPMVAQAIADLAARLDIAPDVIDVIRVEEVEWPDGSLGCPQPDMRYPQVLVNGSFIQLQVGTKPTIITAVVAGRRFYAHLRTKSCPKTCRQSCAAGNVSFGPG